MTRLALNLGIARFWDVRGKSGGTRPDSDVHGCVFREFKLTSARYGMRIDRYARSIRAHCHAQRMRVNQKVDHDADEVEAPGASATRLLVFPLTSPLRASGSPRADSNANPTKTPVVRYGYWACWPQLRLLHRALRPVLWRPARCASWLPLFARRRPAMQARGTPEGRMLETPQVFEGFAQRQRSDASQFRRRPRPKWHTAVADAGWELAGGIDRIYPVPSQVLQCFRNC